MRSNIGPLPELAKSEIVPQSLGDALIEIFHLRAALATERAALAEALDEVKQAMVWGFGVKDERDEALAAKERAERETACWRTEFRERHAEKERAEAERDSYLNYTQPAILRRAERAEHEVARLTAALAGAREALSNVSGALAARGILDRALSHPTTEPAKAEEQP